VSSGPVRSGFLPEFWATDDRTGFSIDHFDATVHRTEMNRSRPVFFRFSTGCDRFRFKPVQTGWQPVFREYFMYFIHKNFFFIQKQKSVVEGPLHLVLAGTCQLTSPSDARDDWAGIDMGVVVVGRSTNKPEQILVRH